MPSGSHLRTSLCAAAFLSVFSLVLGCGAGSGDTAQRAALQIVQQPANQFVQAGQSATFSVRLPSSSVAVSYQWYENNVPVPGATASNLTISSPDVSENGSTVTVRITDAAGSVTSTAAVLTVSPLPAVLTFSTVPQTTFGAAPFPVSASSASAAPVAYAVASGPATITGSSVNVTGVGTVVLSAAQPAAGNYSAATTQTSFAVAPATPTLAFSPMPSISYGAAPFPVIAASASAALVSYAVVSGPATITGSTLSVTGAGTVVLSATQPAAGNYGAATAKTSFTVVPATPTLAFGPMPTLSYGAPPFAVSATSASNGQVSYTLLSGPATLAGNQVTVTGVGTVTLAAQQAATANYAAASAQTTLAVAPNVTLGAITPANLTLAPGQQAFSTTATGGAANTITWSASGGSFTGNTWTSPNTAGTYTVTATSVDQPNRSVSTQVTVSAPVITMQPSTGGACSTPPRSLSVAAQYATGYQWLLNGTPIPGATTATYALSSAATTPGIYTVAVSNGAGTVTSQSAPLYSAFSLTSQPASQTVRAAEAVQFTVAASGVPQPYTYQWFSLAPGRSTAFPIPNATGSTLSTTALLVDDGAQYYATVTDSCGTVLTSQQATLSVQSAPVITTQPSLPSTARNTAPVLSVAAVGNPALSYQWYWVPSGLHQATAIAGATAASYTIPATATAVGNNGDSYYVAITNALGQTTSSTVPVAIGGADPTHMWVVGWGASPENALPAGENPGGNAQSFRSLFYPTLAGTTERVHLSNLYNTAPVTIGAARLAVSAGGSAIDPTHDQPVTFQGQTSITLAPGQDAVSDPVQVAYTAGQKLAVSLYVEGSYRSLTQHESQVNVNYATPSGAGDATGDSTGASFTQSNTEWFVLSGVDVYGAYQGTVAYFGSSSVDGHNSNDGDTNAYPAYNSTPIPGQDNQRPSDWLGHQLVAAGYSIGVLNAGTIGDPAAEDTRTVTGSSVAGVDRFNHDVVQQAGVKAVVIYIGGIDLRSDCLPATNVETSLTNIVQQAQAAGIRVILGTLPPSEYCTTVQPLPNATYPYNGDEFMGPQNPSLENPGSTQRRLLNDWIRSTGAALPGVVAVADFDQALADPNHPDFLKPNFVSADLFHPNGAGYQAQSAAIPLTAILPQ